MAPVWKQLRPATIATLAAVTIAFTGFSQSKPATVLDGVFTRDQAAAGAEVYDTICAECHEGGEPDAPPPIGSEFIERWREAPLGYLYGFVHDRMPADKPGTLSEEQYLDIVSFILEASGYPTGNTPLSAAKVNAILLVGPDGPQPLPASALVRTVGCLTNTGGDEWSLTQAIAPARVRTGDETNPEELATSRAAALGEARYSLKNAEDFPVASLKGKKVQAKGVLTKVENPFTLSVQSLEAAGDACQ